MLPPSSYKTTSQEAGGQQPLRNSMVWYSTVHSEQKGGEEEDTNISFRKFATESWLPDSIFIC